MPVLELKLINFVILILVPLPIPYRESVLWWQTDEASGFSEDTELAGI